MLDLKAMQKASKELDTKRGNKLFFGKKDLSSEDSNFLRIMPPTPEMNGLFYFPVDIWWIDKKPYVSPTTFDPEMVDIVREELDKALAGDDEDAATLADDEKKLQQVKEYWMGAMLLKYVFEDDDETIAEIKVIDEIAKIFKGDSKKIVNGIIKVATKRAFQNGTEDGFTDRRKGFNVEVVKSGKGIDTDYSVEGADQWSFDAKYYKNAPDVVALAKASVYSRKYLRAVIKKYLYNEPIPEALEASEKARRKKAFEEYQAAHKIVAAPASKKKLADEEEDDEDSRPVKKPQTKRRSSDEDDEDDEPVVKKSASKKRRPVDEDDEDDEDEAPVRKKKAKPQVEDEDDEDEDDDEEFEDRPVKKSKRKPVDEDEDEGDDEDEEDRPAPKKKTAPKKKPVDDDDDDEEIPFEDDDDDDDEAPKPKKKSAPSKPASSGKKRNLIADIDDLD